MVVVVVVVDLFLLPFIVHAGLAFCFCLIQIGSSSYRFHLKNIYISASMF